MDWGQFSDGYVLLRGVLEQALYAWNSARNPDLVKTWLMRIDGVEEKKQMKKKFQFKPIVTALIEEDKLVGERISSLYDSTIDFGAHPNVFGVIGETEILSNEKEVQMNLQYIYGDGDYLRLFLKDVPRIGIGALLLLEKIYENKFKILNLDMVLRNLSQGLLVIILYLRI